MSEVKASSIFFKENKEDPWTILQAKSRDDCLEMSFLAWRGASVRQGISASVLCTASIFLKKVVDHWTFSNENER